MNSGTDLERRVARHRQQHEERLVAAAAAGRSPSLDERLAAAGTPDGPAGLSDFEALPVLSKDDLPALQDGQGYAAMLGPGADVAHVFASPGPIYEPQLAVPDPWRFAAAVAACGIGADDLVLNCFNYHLSPAGIMFDEASRSLGARVLPGGVGMTEVQARAVADLGVTGYIGLPSYLASLIEAFDAAHGPEAWRVEKALVSAEPLPDPLRARLQERVPTVLMAYGTAEVGLIGYETEPGSGLRVEETTYVEICEPGTGNPLPDGEPGEVVVTVLGDDAYPLVRFGTGDVSRWVPHGDGDEIRLAGVLGRVGAAVKVRGMFVHPHQAAAVRDSLGPDGVTDARFVVESDGDKDRFTLEVAMAGDADRDAVADAAVRRCRGELRLRPELRIVSAVAEGPVLVDLRG